jgi:hypothetical protein
MQDQEHPKVQDQAKSRKSWIGSPSWVVTMAILAVAVVLLQIVNHIVPPKETTAVRGTEEDADEVANLGHNMSQITAAKWLTYSSEQKADVLSLVAQPKSTTSRDTLIQCIDEKAAKAPATETLSNLLRFCA